MNRRRILAAILAGAALLGGALSGGALWGAAARADNTNASEAFLVLGSTTTTENSGLLNHLRPLFEADTGISLRVVVAGTGKILKLAESGDVDVSLTHHPDGEAAFVAAGLGAYRREVMANDFLLVGPGGDPTNLRSAAGISDALRRLADSSSLFISRGDESGTHRKEIALLETAGVAPEGAWRRETGAGMGATLNIAAGLGGYTLVDRGTWASFANRGEMAVMVEGGESLRNPYGVILPTPPAAPLVRRREAEAFINWLTGARGQAAIAAFRIDGEQVFKPASP